MKSTNQDTLGEYQIYKTTDYSRFKLHPLNRAVRKGHVQQLVRAFRQSDYTPINPIRVNDNWEIVDGQHEFFACRELKLPIYYIKSSIANGKMVIAALNSTTTPWAMEDYLQFYIKGNNPHYIKLKQYADTYEVPLAVLLVLFQDSSVNTMTRDIRSKFKNGLFVIENEERVKTFIEDIFNELKPFMGDYTAKCRPYYYSLIYLMNIKFSPIDKIIEKVKVHNVRIHPLNNVGAYLRFWEDTYNIKSPVRRKIF